MPRQGPTKPESETMNRPATSDASDPSDPSDIFPHPTNQPETHQPTTTMKMSNPAATTIRRAVAPAAFAALALIPAALRGELIAHYNGEETSGPLVDQAGGQTAAEMNSGHLYQQAGAAAGTYGAITLTNSLGNAVGITAGQTGAWRLDGGDEDELQNLTNNFTVMSWVFVPSTGIGNDWPRVIGDSRPVATQGWNFGINNKVSGSLNTVALVGNGVGGYYSTQGDVTNGVWQHIAATKSSTGGVTLYLNGNVVKTIPAATGAFNSGSDVWYLGSANNATTDENIEGLLMDEVRVYNEVLDAAAIIAAAEDGQIVPEPTAPSFNTDPVVKADAEQDHAYTGQTLADDVTDPDTPPGGLTFTKLSSEPAWLTVAANGALSGTPGPADTGINTWLVQVSDGTDTDTATLQISVGGPPSFVGDPVTKPVAAVGEDYAVLGATLAGSATDPLDDPLTYAYVSGPAWLTIAPDGALSGTPGSADAGLNSWTISVSDGGTPVEATLEILVFEFAPPPPGSLIAHYTCEETAGPLVDQAGGETAAEDRTGHLYEQAGAPAGTYGAITLTGSLGNAVGIETNADGSWSLDLTDSAELGDLVNNFTVMTWVYIPEGGIGDDWPRTIGDNAAYDADGWNFGIRNKAGVLNAVALTGNGIAAFNSTPGVVTSGAWQHIAVTKSDTTGVTFYVNGVQVGNDTSANALGDFIASDDIWGVGGANGPGNTQAPPPDANINDLLMDEVRVYNVVLGGADIIAAAEGGALAGGEIQLAVSRTGNQLAFTWNSRAGKQYDLLSATSLDTPRGTWPVYQSYQDLPADPSGANLLAGIPLDGAIRFFAVREEDLLDEGFESASLPAGWGPPADNGNGTAWQFGEPDAATGADTGPTGGFESTNCAGTNILAKYTPEAEARLKTKAIAVPAGGATLAFQQWIDTESPPSGDFGAINVLDADNADAFLATLNAGNIEGFSGAWEAKSFSLSAYADMNIKLEFVFESDPDAETWAGWYIDDVMVTAD